MSKELEEFYEEEVEQEEVEQVEQVEEAEEEKVNPHVESATKDGWLPLEDWKEKGRDPDDWVSKKKFDERGRMLADIKYLRDQQAKSAKDIEDRLSANNKFHELQRKAMLEDLESKRSQAVDNGDHKAVIDTSNQINDLNNTPAPNATPAQPSGADIVSNFNRDNPWIMENTPKSGYAQMQFNHYSRSMTPDAAISRMMDDVSREFPDVNPNRDKAPVVQRNTSRPGGKKAPRSLTMAEVTHKEMKIRDFFGDDNQFLKAVQDARVKND